MPSRSDKGGVARFAIAVIVVGVALRVMLLGWADGTMIDDAYITVRYAQNLIDDGALVYNTGEHVLGVSGPFYAFWVAAHLLLIPARHIGYTLGASNTLLFAATAFMLLSVVSEIGRRTAVLVVVLFATYVRFVDNSLTGMETPLFLLGMVWSLILLKRERFAWLSLLTSLLMRVRPEGVLWALSLLTVIVLRRSRLRVIDVVPGAVVLAVWTVFSTMYYGSPIPQSVWAKSGWIVPGVSPYLTDRIASVFSSLTLLELPAGFDLPRLPLLSLVVGSLASLALFIVGARDLARRRSVLFALSVLFPLYLVFYLAAKGRVDFSWYGIPSGLAYAATVTAGLSWLAVRFIARSQRRRLFAVLTPVLVVALVVGSAVVWRQKRLPYVRLVRASYERAGEFIDLNCPPDTRILLSETGMIGWKAARPTHELAGVVSPEILRYRAERHWDVSLQELLERFGTDIVVLDPTCLTALERDHGTEWVERNYRVLARFSRHTVLKRSD